MGGTAEAVQSLHKHSHRFFLSPERENIRILTPSKAAAIEGCAHRKAGKVMRLIFVSEELLEFLSGLESVQLYILNICGYCTVIERFAVSQSRKCN